MVGLHGWGVHPRNTLGHTKGTLFTKRALYFKLFLTSIRGYIQNSAKASHAFFFLSSQTQRHSPGQHHLHKSYTASHPFVPAPNKMGGNGQNPQLLPMLFCGVLFALAVPGNSIDCTQVGSPTYTTPVFPPGTTEACFSATCNLFVNFNFGGQLVQSIENTAGGYNITLIAGTPSPTAAGTGSNTLSNAGSMYFQCPTGTIEVLFTFLSSPPVLSWAPVEPEEHPPTDSCRYMLKPFLIFANYANVTSCWHFPCSGVQVASFKDLEIETDVIQVIGRAVHTVSSVTTFDVQCTDSVTVAFTPDVGPVGNGFAFHLDPASVAPSQEPTAMPIDTVAPVVPSSAPSSSADASSSSSSNDDSGGLSTLLLIAIIGGGVAVLLLTVLLVVLVRSRMLAREDVSDLSESLPSKGGAKNGYIVLSKTESKVAKEQAEAELLMIE